MRCKHLPDPPLRQAMDQDLGPPSAMRPRRRTVPLQRKQYQTTPYPRRVITPSQRASTVYVDEDGSEEREEAHRQSKGGIVGMVVAVVIVIVVFVVVVWWMCRRAARTSSSVNTQSIPINNATGKPLITEDGACSANSDCRRGLECFQGRCSTNRRISELKRAKTPPQADVIKSPVHPPPASKQDTPPPPSQEEKDRALREREENAQRALQKRAEEAPKRKHVVIGSRRSPNRFEYAKEAGLRSILRPANAVSNADQDFGY
jgi:hypothetical protein